MAQFVERRMLLATKIEGTEGTVNAPAGSDANFLGFDVKCEADIPVFERRPVAVDLSPYTGIPGGRRAKITFKAEIKGSGSAGTAPAIGKLLKACGFGETVTASTSVVYDPIGVAIPTLTIDAYAVPESGNSIRFRMKGARGTVKLTAKVGEPGMLEFEFFGVYDGVTDQSIITASGLETTLPPALLSAAFSIHSFSAKVSGFGLDVGSEGVHREDISLAAGYLSYAITGRRPSFSFDPEKDLVATHDYFGRWIAGTEGALSVAYGATAGNILTITAPKVQYTKVDEGSRGGLSTFPVQAKLNRSSGNDELKFAFT